MAFGAVRDAYKAPARFFADNPTADNQILWYYVPDDREVYDDWTVFWPRVDVPPDEATHAFEKEVKHLRQHFPYLGADVFGFPGTHVHGDPEDFRGLALRKKYFVGDVPPLPPCPDIRAFVRFAIGIECPEPEPAHCACCEGHEWSDTLEVLIDHTGVPSIDGMTFGITVTSDGGACTFTGGTPLGVGGFIEISGLFSGLPTGLAVSANWTTGIGGLGAAHVSTDTVLYFNCVGPQTASDGQVIDDITSEPTGHRARFTIGPRIIFDVAFAVGITVADPPPPPEAIPLGLAIGLTVTDPPPPPPMPIGLSMGLTVTDP